MPPLNWSLFPGSQWIVGYFNLSFNWAILPKWVKRIWLRSIPWVLSCKFRERERDRRYRWGIWGMHGKSMCSCGREDLGLMLLAWALDRIPHHLWRSGCLVRTHTHTHQHTPRPARECSGAITMMSLEHIIKQYHRGVPLYLWCPQTQTCTDSIPI